MRVLCCTTLVLVHLVWGFLADKTQACNVPVFRYALERWTPDDYEVVVFHHDALDDKQQKLVTSLENHASDPTAPANLTVRLADLAAPLDERDTRLLENFDLPEATPWMLVRYPAFTKTDRLAFSGPLDEETVEALTDSPARSDVANRILEGDSAVWVLVESGDKEKDDAAEQILNQQLKHLEETLELPGSAESEIDDLFPAEEPEPDSSSPLSVAFSLLRVARNDPAEQVFVSMLINSESDLHEFQEPIAIPVFGRGRAYLALVGKGINEDTIDESCRFLAGACSCEVKVQNPGADMLVRADWDSFVSDERHHDENMPQLIGLGSFENRPPRSVSQTETVVAAVPPRLATSNGATPHATSDSGHATGNPTAKVPSTAASGTPFYWYTIAIVGTAALLVIGGTVLIRFRQGSPN